MNHPNHRRAARGMQRSASRGAQPPTMFQGCPISKAVATFTVGSFLLKEMLPFDDFSFFPNAFSKLDYADFSHYGYDGESLYRVISSQITFETVGELIFGLGLLIPMLRKFEREMSSRRFASYLVYSWILATFWQFLIATQFLVSDITTVTTSSRNEDATRNNRDHNTQSEYSMATIKSGPYILLGSVCLLYHLHTPRLYPKLYGVLGMNFSDKSVNYFLIFNLIIGGSFASFFSSSSPESSSYSSGETPLNTILPFTCGALAGFLCITPIFSPWNEKYLQELPEFVYKMAYLIGAPLFSDDHYRRNPSAPTIVYGGPIAAALMRGGIAGAGAATRSNDRAGSSSGREPVRNTGARQRLVPPTQQNFAAPPPPPPPTEEMIENLTSMGFERENVIRALRETHNNLEHAANRLLMSS